MTMEVNIVLIRDGAPLCPEGPFLSGNIPLGKDGKKIISEKVSNSVYPAVSRVYTDPCARCRETASLIYRIPALVVPIVHYDYSGLENMAYREAVGSDVFRTWARSVTACAIGNGEPPYLVQQRNILIFRGIVERLAEKYIPSAALVTHKTVILTVINRYLTPGFFYFYEDIPHGGGYLISFDIETETLKIKKNIN